MDNRNLRRWLTGAFAISLQTIAAAQSVRISELHYDNTGTDTGEAIEIAGPAGTDLAGWQVQLYNGLNGLVYNTRELNGVLPATCDARGVLVLSYPSNGIQNGSPDGIALVDVGGAVVEFLSYEGTFAAVDGAAAGLTATDIGVAQNGTEPVGASLALGAGNAFFATSVNSFGACNTDEPQPPAAVASITVTPANASLTVGASVTLSATAFDIEGAAIPATAFTWTSNAPELATVTPNGVVTASAAGSLDITATAANGVAGSARIDISDAPPPSDADVRINEIHYDNLGADAGEAIEIEGAAGTDVNGYSLVLYNGNGGVPYNTQVISAVLPASCGARGVLVVSYPADGLQNGPDGIALVDPLGQVVEFLSYEGTFIATSGAAAGLTSIDIGAAQNSAAAGQSLQRGSANDWTPGTSSFGACNPDAPPPGGNTLSFSGRVPSDPPLPVGFQDQLFATLRSPSNSTIPTVISWVSETPAVASIEPNGVMTALAAGTATVRATAEDGTTATWSLPTRVAVASTTADYVGNAEFGEPVDADASDDLIVRHPQYTASYNPARGTPNWVSYDLELTHFGDEDRCDCFTSDPALPETVTRLTTADYTDAGAFHGFGIDRGHLVRSFDRTSGSLDNAVTYLFTNIVPQAADMNQGPWAVLENFLGDLARFDDREVYVITGVAGNTGTLKNQGRVVIPASTWKVAVVMPRNLGLNAVVDYRDLDVYAVDMPNTAGIRNVPWQTYLTTVDAIEAVSGYDLLALLPDEVEAAVESGTEPPIASIAGPAGPIETGDDAAFSASGSIDPNGAIVGYAWDFGDGATASGVSVAHTYARAGVFTVRLLVTDDSGLTDTATFSITVEAGAGLADAHALVDALLASGRITRGTGALLNAQVSTAQLLLARGNVPAAAAMLRVMILELDLLVRLRVLTTVEAAPLRNLLITVIATLAV